MTRIGAWPPSRADRAAALAALERSEVVVLPRLGFALEPGEEGLLDPRTSDGRAKNISLDGAGGRLRGVRERRAAEAVRGMMVRFAEWSQLVAAELLPGYAAALGRGKTSFRPCPIEGRATSPRRDDRRLHVDAFRAQPVQGRRILRLFANVDQEGAPREWLVGESFEAFAGRFPRALARPAPGQGLLLERLGLTRGRRTAYDRVMLRLHDLAKADAAYQASAPRQCLTMPAGSAWIVFSDSTVHAAVSGRNALEQTFFLPVEAMEDPGRSPLCILEGMADRPLI